MKKFNLLFLLALLVSAVIFTSCENDTETDDPTDSTQLTIAEYASQNADFSILLEALSKANLVSTLDGAGDFTVFAPDNDAFNMLFEDLGVSGIEDISAETLSTILLYHVLGQSMTSDMLSDRYYSSLSPAQGRYVSMKINTMDGVNINGNANVVAADINVSNGVIHSIDNVLLPPTIVDLAVDNGNFNTLVGAVTSEGLATTLSDPSGTFTVFAPTDEAFAALGGNLPADLTPVLLYHVLGSPVFADQVSSSIIESLNATDPEIIVEATMEGVKLNGMANIVATDIVGTNGVIHVIDQVIIPIDNNSIIDIAMGMDDTFSSLVSALASTNLATTFMMGGDYTVFAPTNDAFSSFLQAAGVAFEDLTAEDLTPILMYHVIGAKAMSTDLSTGYKNTIYEAIEGNPVSMLIEVNDGVVLNGSTNVTIADVEASNGVVHVIDNVLTPTTVVDIAINNSSFTKLVEAVVKAGLVETLNGEGPFTVFAPTDEAFDQVLADLGVSSVDDLDAATLAPILQYHVVSGNVKSTDLAEGEVATLNGNITISLGDMPMINGNTEIINTDIQGTNGVVHVIDKVLIP